MTHLALRATVLLAFAPLLGACGNLSPSRAALVATGYVSHQLCSAVFVAGLDPERAYREAIEPVAGPLTVLERHHVDRERAEVRATIAGLAESRAVHRPPYGCVNATGLANTSPLDETLAAPAVSALPVPPLLAPIAGPAVVEPADPRLRAALDRAFDEARSGPRRNTHAIVVVQRDRIVAERYAEGIGIETPLTGWSATKSVTNALLGILVRQGRLDMNAPAPIAAWADPNDPRHAITPDQLLRMTSGLDAGQSLHDVSAFDPAARMLFAESDMAAFAASRPLAHAPGTHWNYADPNTMLLSRIVRDLAGGSPDATRAFVQRELFDKLGMQNATLEFDASGTPIGGSHLWASARDWARLGLLYLNDGMVGGERLLPSGWIAYSATQTPGAEYVGYGAGFWTNRARGYGAEYRAAAGIPADAFMARGTYGQYVVIVPSQQLVVVRLGPAWTRRDDMDTVARFTRDVIDALRSPA
jgi:CubicO group peptidase (beta-lactamase class C family)